MGYLNSQLSYGVFTGVSGANVEMIMRLDLGIQITSVLLNAEMGTAPGSAIEAYFKSLAGSDNISKHETRLADLIKWLILNYCGTKSKTSPAGLRIYTLCSNVETVLGKLSVSE